MAIIKRETDYALRALAKLGRTKEFLPVSVLAEQEDVPETFLRKIMQRLHQAGIVQSRQGPFGGYRLALPPAEIALLHVVETVQGPLVMNECFANPEMCERTDFCPFRARLAALQVELNARLDEVRLSGILKEIASRQKAAG